MRFLRVNMTDLKVQDEPVPERYRDIGGRGLTSILVNEEVPADCDPLGPENKLVFAPGFFTGTQLVNTSRLSVGGKSPLTGGIKESNVGGTVAYALAKLGIAAVVVEGKVAKPESCYQLIIDQDGGAQLQECSRFCGMRTYALVEELRKIHGEKKSITCIGPAGEMQLLAASIQSTDLDGRPCRAAGRGGLGAVMGAKGLKALVVDRGGRNAIELVDPETFKTAAKSFAQAVKADEFSGKILPELGTAALVEPINAAGAFPTYNARSGQFAGAEKISGESLAAMIKERGGQTTHKGCAQCIIDCSNVVVNKNGEYVTSSLEYETIWAMGGMIGNDDLDAIARLDFLCDDIGLDTMSTGVAIGIAMDAGYRQFGDSAAAIALVEEVATGSEIGRVIGNGPDAVGRHFNHGRVPTVKGQSIAAYDPRALQGMAVTYATTPMGGDHTAGWVVAQNLEAFGGTINPHEAEGQVELSRGSQIHMAAVDSVGICDFAQSGLATPEGMENVRKMYSARTGKPFAEDSWPELGERVLRAERDFNRKAGFTAKDDHLPSMFYTEPLPPYNVVVKVTDEEMENTFQF